jgi:hypothetical protein
MHATDVLVVGAAFFLVKYFEYVPVLSVLDRHRFAGGIQPEAVDTWI